MSGSLISCILCLLTSFSVSTCFFPLSLFVSVFCSPRFHKLFYLSFNPFILSSEPQHFFLSCLFSLSLSSCLCLSVCSFYSSNQVYCDGVCDNPTDKNLPNRKCMQKMYFASTGCFDTFVYQFFQCVYIVCLKKKKTLSNDISVFWFVFKDMLKKSRY